MRILYLIVGCLLGTLLTLNATSNRLYAIEDASIRLAAATYYRACVEASGLDCKQKAEAVFKELKQIQDSAVIYRL